MVLLEDKILRVKELVPVNVYQDSEEVSLAVAQELAKCIRSKESEGTPCVLGLATGSSPMRVYRELVRMHKEDGLSFRNVITFNLDEYYPMEADALQSYHLFMWEHLFNHVDIDHKNVHIPNGTIRREDVARHCEEYEAAIESVGGIDIQLLGLGRTGHIGFNEKGSSRSSRTRLISLDKVTRVDAASDFFGETDVPRRAITMGVATILEAKRIIMMAFGENKSLIVKSAVEGPVTEQVAASYLQEHSNATVYLDYAAAAGLTRVQSPWVLGPVQWDPLITRKAVLWLAIKLGKPLLKLTDEDYNENAMQDLLADQGPAYNINLKVFYHLQRTITGWPGGKAHSKQNGAPPQPTNGHAAKAKGTVMDAQEPQHYSAYGKLHDVSNRNLEFPKRVLIMSPHPDDDVISMGGTFIRLVDQGHEVHVAYQTSGNIAVWDEDALRFADFVHQFGRSQHLDTSRTATIAHDIETALRCKKPGQVDSPAVANIKTLIRYTEARAAGRSCGAALDNLHFLDMPFYDTGKVVKKPLSDADISILVDLFDKVQPHQIYAAGDLSDPHGTHRVCLQAIFKALDIVKHRSWWKDSTPEVWLYRGAWQEWEPWEIEMAVPLSPGEMAQKISAIFKHQSQKDRALFPGSDSREFWQRAQDRNKATAQLYDQLGLPEYEGMEAFVMYDPHGPSHLFKNPAAK